MKRMPFFIIPIIAAFAKALNRSATGRKSGI